MFTFPLHSMALNIFFQRLTQHSVRLKTTLNLYIKQLTMGSYSGL